MQMRLPRVLFVLALCLLPVTDAGSPPSKEELRKKTTKQLKAILSSKGTRCKKCVEKDDYVERVLETWDWAPKEASTPDGKVQITKEAFINHLKEGYRRHVKEQREQAGHQMDDEEEEEDGEVGKGLPNLDQAWAEFSAKLQQGDVKTDKNGQLVYEVNTTDGPAGTFWDKYKTHLLILMNLVLLIWMQYAKKGERAAKLAKLKEAKEKQEKEKAAAEAAKAAQLNDGAAKADDASEAEEEEDEASGPKDKDA